MVLPENPRIYEHLLPDKKSLARSLVVRIYHQVHQSGERVLLRHPIILEAKD
jgi:hypothetical protein